MSHAIETAGRVGVLCSDRLSAGMFSREWRQMFKDRYGNPLSTSSQAARDAYVDALDRLLAANEGAEEGFLRAIEADPDFALAYVGLARDRQMRGEAQKNAAPVVRALELVDRVTEQESGHIAALCLMLNGRIPDAVKAIRAHVAVYPRDVLVAHTCMGVFGLIGFSGQRGREAEQLAFTTALAPHYGDDWWFLSQHAFAQLEVGQTALAEHSIERSLEINPKSGNGAHVRSHLYYENGEAEAGLEYLKTWRENYSRQALLHCHVSWHIGLWALQQGDVATMWHVLDTDILPDAPSGPTLNVMTDASALLYRAELAGHDVPVERWRAVSAYATQHFPKPGLAFADVHAALAHALAGETEAVSRIIKEARGPAGDLVGAFAEAFAAIASGSWKAAAAHLTRAMADHARIGGSRAQRDLLEFALALTLLKQGHSSEARMLLALHRPHVVAGNVVHGL